MHSLVSVIVPNYNRESTLRQTIESVLNQTYTNWELIIVDDGSTDDSWMIISEFERMDKRILAFQRDNEPKGPSSCRNIGIKQARGKYLIFLDSDDVFSEHCLSGRVEFMDEKSDLDFAVFNLEKFKELPGDLGELFNRNPGSNDSYLNMFLRSDLPWACPCPVWKRDFLLNQGGFDEKMLIMEDPELHARVLLDNPSFMVMRNSKPDCYYRIGSFNSAKEQYFHDSSIRCRIYFIEKMASLIQNKATDQLKKQKRELRFSIIRLMRVFLLNRIKDYKEEYKAFFLWAGSIGIFTKLEFLWLRLLGRAFLSNSSLIEFLRLKGLAYRLYRL